MGNAIDAVKTVARFETSTNSEDGVAKVIVAVDAQLLQERRQAGHRAAAGQHDMHAQRARLGDGRLGPLGECLSSS